MSGVCLKVATSRRRTGPPQPYKINLPSRRIRTVLALLPRFAKNELRQSAIPQAPAPLCRPTPSTPGLPIIRASTLHGRQELGRGRLIELKIDLTEQNSPLR
jgi:hypothetical protein